MFRTLILGLVASLIVIVVVGSPVAFAEPEQSAQQQHETTPQHLACTGAGGTFSDGTCSTGGKTLESGFKDIANALIFIIGAIAVVVIIIGGIRYVVSGGSDQAVAGAKNMILFAIVGIVLAIFAYAIVNFVIGALS